MVKVTEAKNIEEAVALIREDTLKELCVRPCPAASVSRYVEDGTQPSPNSSCLHHRQVHPHAEIGDAGATKVAEVLRQASLLLFNTTAGARSL